ncbi:MAG: hypothetical protein PUF12_05150 [Thermoflexaceae bacterium]|nr:hypothetical protein [Thermoflexaceae bacterium]
MLKKTGEREDLPDTIQTLEKQRKKLHILQIMRQIGRFTVAAVLLVSVVVFLFYLIFCLYLIFIAEDTETTITNVPWILKWMDDTTISDDLFSTLWVVAVCADIALLIVYAKYNCKFRALYKETFVMPVIQDFFEQVQYRYNEGFHSQQIRQFSLVKNGNNIISEDYILGTYRNVRFEQAEVIVKNSSRFALISGNVAGIMLHIRNMLSSRTINRKTKAGKRKERIKTYFAGQMLTFSFPKEHVKSLHVFSRNYKNRPNLDAASSHIVKMENVVLMNISMYWRAMNMTRFMF